MEIFVDAENAIAGRVASYVAKNALLGHKVVVVNCDKAIISGSKQNVFANYHHKMCNLGQPTKGPIPSRMPDRFFRRMIRGMLPHKITRGVEAFKRTMCYVGVPISMKDKTFVKVPGADFSKLQTMKFITIRELCKLLGA